MPDSKIPRVVAALLCLLTSAAICQTGSSLSHYLDGEKYLQDDNLQAAANEFRAALSGNLDPPWTVVWSHLKLAGIYDATGQHDQALNEYRQAVSTGDNTRGALDQAKTYLEHAGQAVYLPRQEAAPHPQPTYSQPIQRTEPEYTDEARLAQLEGTVVLQGSIDEEGVARNLEIARPIGLGLDEKAIEAVKQWHFAVSADEPFNIEVTFRLPSKQSFWHLIRVQFDTPAGVSRPIFMSALYPIGAGIGAEADEEARVVRAIGRVASAKLTFDIDEQGIPTNFQVVDASETVWGIEATALVGQWRFKPAMKNGFPVRVLCTVELTWGEPETRDLGGQLHDVLTPR